MKPEHLPAGWISPDWPAPANVRAFCTSRAGGFSTGPWASMNLGERCGDDPESVRRNRAQLCRYLPGPPRWLQQVHGARAVQFEDVIADDTAADAVTARQAGQVCAVMTADCLPVLFCNRAGDRVAAAHAGWRGLAAGVLEATVEQLGGDPGEVLAWLGPAIGPGSYEVGPEVAGAFPHQYPGGFKRHGDRWLMDLYTLARLRLNSVGVDSISGGEFCSYSDEDRFFSYRRDGVTGRMASLVWSV